LQVLSYNYGMKKTFPQLLKSLFDCSLKIACLLSLALLSACQTLQTESELDSKKIYLAGDASYATRQQEVDSLRRWKIEGVFSYADAQDSVATGKLLWEKKGDKDTIQLIGPIGFQVGNN